MSLSAVSLSSSLLLAREESSLLTITGNPDVFSRLSEMLPGGGAELLLANKKIKKCVLSTFSSFRPEVKLHLMFLAKQPLIERVKVLQEEIIEAEGDIALTYDALRAFRQANQAVISWRKWVTCMPCLRPCRCIWKKFQRLEVLLDDDLQSRERLRALKAEQKKLVIEIFGFRSSYRNNYLEDGITHKARNFLKFFSDAGSAYESIYDIVGGARDFYKLPEYSMSLAANRARRRAEAAALQESAGPRPQYYAVVRNSWCRNIFSQDMSDPIMRGFNLGRPFILFKSKSGKSNESQRALVIFQTYGHRWGSYIIGAIPPMNIRAIWSIEGFADLSFDELGERFSLRDTFEADIDVDLSGNDGVLPFLKGYADFILKKEATK
jgi:hypothetical protein